jgi:acetyl-CoA acyltransferase
MHAFVLIIYLFINFIKMIKKVVFIDGVRTPFLKSGTDYMDLMSYQLGQFAIKGLLDKTGIDPNEIDRVILGNVISNVKTENVAREAAVTAGVPIKVPANTVKQACISANQAISNAMIHQLDIRKKCVKNYLWPKN